MPPSTPSWWLFWLRLAAIVPAAALVTAGRGGHRGCSRRKLEHSLLVRLSRVWLPLADEPDDGMREVALCAMVALFSDSEQSEHASMPQLDWRLAGACVPYSDSLASRARAFDPQSPRHGLVKGALCSTKS